jgi:hypothetical protein
MPIVISAQVLSLIRSALLIAGGVATSKGVIDSSTMTTIVGGIMSVVPTIWSLFTHSKTSIIAAAAALPEVTKVVTTPEIAHSPRFAEDPTVVAPGDH